nr:hypothetical protein BSM_05290 [uncultured archaeon]CBH38005.1 hypothetical protein BSM_14820 [uncultured archaeon]CBH38008.1 hypothetical protein BSM_14850 [uncultured archaeon]CBH38195.1 conserved hypothetical protein [uncultured archaeon]CBH38522.1 hypothetical protein BSM_19990 [uncultured archaeon]
METNVSEPLRKCRKRRDDVKTRGWSLTWDKSGRAPAYCPDGVRHEGGVNMVLALVWNVGTYPLMLREKHKWEDPTSVRVPMQGNRGGPARISDEVSVMEIERRGWVILLDLKINQEMGGIFDESKAI